MASTDYGASWKIVTDWNITEVTKVYLDPMAEKTIYATSSSFVWKSADYGVTWKKIVNGLRPTSQTYCNGLAMLPSNTSVLFLATADGIMKSDNGGESWQPCGLSGREVHEIRFAPNDESVLAAATDDAGVFISRDGGKVWRQRAMGMRGRTIYTIAFDPVEKGVLYCGGYLCGINKSIDYGEKWTPLYNEISDRTVRALAIWPTDNKLILAGLLNYGLWRSDDGGAGFHCAAECDGRVYCLGIFKTDSFMKRFSFYLMLIALMVFDASAADYAKKQQQRCDSLVTYFKKLPFAVDALRAMVKLNKGYDIPTALRIVDSVTAKPRGDMFWLYPAMSMYLYGQKNMPMEYKAKVRQALKNYTPYRGDTENHWVMYYTALYLASQTWPGEPGPSWFNGKSSEENLLDAEGWLNHWMTTTTTIGQGEFDSPAYLTFYLTPMFMLHQHSKDAVMKKRPRS